MPTELDDLRAQLADERAAHAADVAGYGAAFDRIMTGGNSLASVLVGIFDAKIPPYETDFEVARNKIKDPDTYDLWLCWAVMMRERDALAADPGPLVAAVEQMATVLGERHADTCQSLLLDCDCKLGHRRRNALAAYRAALKGEA